MAAGALAVADLPRQDSDTSVVGGSPQTPFHELGRHASFSPCYDLGRVASLSPCSSARRVQLLVCATGLRLRFGCWALATGLRLRIGCWPAPVRCRRRRILSVNCTSPKAPSNLSYSGTCIGDACLCSGSMAMRIACASKYCLQAHHILTYMLACGSAGVVCTSNPPTCHTFSCDMSHQSA